MNWCSELRIVGRREHMGREEEQRVCFGEGDERL